MTPGKNIRRIRRAKDITQREAAAQCGMIVQSWSRIETGNITPRLQTLERMAKALNCKVAEFFEDQKPII